MRKINPSNFKIANRTTSREINRQIALNLIQAHQPISRAALARKMNLGRGVITVLSQELIQEGAIFEGENGSAPRGRKPTLLYLKTDNRLVVAVDIRRSNTFIMLTDFSGKQIALEIFETILAPDEMLAELTERIKLILKRHNLAGICEGIGLVVPGIVEYSSGNIIRTPTLGWKKINLSEKLSKAVNLPVKIENAPKACALAQLWLNKSEALNFQNFVYVSVSDGVGCGIVINGELVRGKNDLAGEFGHVRLFGGDAQCSCGKIGCWEAYTSNLATISRYQNQLSEAERKNIAINELIELARTDDARALNSLIRTAEYLGYGLAGIVNGLNPERIFLGGEITTAWDIIGKNVREAMASRALSKEAGKTLISIAQTNEYPRLKGAAALIVAPAFAALKTA